MPSERFPPESPVFVAEGDPGGKVVLRRIFREFQFRNVTMQENAYKALHTGRVERFALLLISQTVDKGDGVKLVSSIRAEGKNRDAPIVFMLGEEDGEAEQQAASAGATAVVRKPLEAEPLREVLEGILGKRILTLSQEKEGEAPDAPGPEAGEDPRLREKVLLEEGEEGLRAGDFEAAREAFAAAVAVRSGSVEGQAGLGEALRGLGDAGGARAAFETALSIGERPDDLHVYNRMGMAARRRGDYEGAVRAFDKALFFDPADPVLHYNKSLVFIAQRKYREALLLLKRALELEPGFVEARHAGDTIIESLRNSAGG